MLDPWRIQMEGSPAVRRFLHERSQAASNGFSGITEHETRDTAFSNHGYCRWPFAGSRSRSRYASRDTKHGFTVLVPCQRFPTISHYFPVVPRYPPPANQASPRTAAAGSAASWMHRVAAQAPLASRSRQMARRSMPGSRITAWKAFPNHESRDTKHGLHGRSVRRGCARVAPPETAVRTTAPADKSLFSSSQLFTIVHYCSLLFAIVRRKTLPLRQCPCPVSRSPSASRRAPLAGQILLPSGLLRCRERHTNPC